MIVLVPINILTGQVNLRYSLTSNFAEQQDLHAELIPLANASSHTGYFGGFMVPGSTCPDTSTVSGYYFYDNAGLKFENDQFIDCDYSIKFTFNVDDLSGPPIWIRLINFNPNSDDGIYIRLTNPPLNGSLEFWPNGLVGAQNFFSPHDLYQFILTRTCAGIVNVYVNGEFFATYNDSSNPRYLVQDPYNVIIFFQDDSAVPNEASPGWVTNIVISDFAWDMAMIEDEWENFCNDLLEVDCAGTTNGTAVVDDCGECLEPTDPNFNMLCADCAGTPNGTAVIDDCGLCLHPSDPGFNMSCADCAGTPNGTAVIDDCGICLHPSDPNFNMSCADCAGTPNGSAVFDVCGVCLDPLDPNFNMSCADCAGIYNGSAIFDNCGKCLQPTDPTFNLSCKKSIFIPNAFSPNDDGVNDELSVLGNENLQLVVSFTVYDRWGGVVWHAKNFLPDGTTHWNGDSHGNEMPTGVYFWICTYEEMGGTVNALSGDVMLLR